MSRQIACGHCGGTHSSVAEVRACSAEHPISQTSAEPTFAPSSAPGGPPATGTRVDAAPRGRSQATAAPSPAALDQPLARSAEELAGPARLGRSLVISPDASIPEPWAEAPVIEASSESDEATVDRLHHAWRRRERIVVVWSGPLPASDPVLENPFHELTPSSELPGERLRFALTANSINLLDDDARFEPISLAMAGGAKLGDGPEQTSGDVITRHGEVVWVDGGPLDRFDATDLGGVGVVPRPHLVAGTIVAVTLDPPSPGADLAPDQLSAVGHRGGPARIIAPAGSGKTRVLTERTRHLINDRALEAATVSLVAYNRRARLEMEERLHDIEGLDIRTLNSLALAIASGTGRFATGRNSPRLRTITEIDSRRLLDRVVPGRRRRQLTDPLEPWIDALSACRLGLRDPHEIEAAYGGDVAGFPEVLDSYRAELQRRGELDFDEQILTALHVLVTDPEARRVARRATPVLLIDEFQDLTPAHLLLVRLLAGPAAEVFAVGDDDQTIYGYSGAKPDWLVHFDQFFPGAADHPLTVNYRCPPAVVEAASNLLTHNRNRVRKTIVAGHAPDGEAPKGALVINGDAPEGALVINRDIDPQQRLVDHVEALLAQGSSPSDIAVLARVHAALLPATIYLANAGFAVAKPVGVDGHMLERSGVAAALSWLRLATAPEQRLRSDDLRLALRRPPRSIHPRITDWVCEQRSVKDLVALSGRLNKERESNLVAEFAADIQRLRDKATNVTTEALLDFIYDDIGLLGAASQLDQSQRTARRAAHADELGALAALARIGPDGDELEGWIRAHLEALPRHDDADRGETITLATIHTTKGLEWPHVVVHDVRGDLHPHRLATDTEEERRIFHVAITRCRESVLVNAVPKGAPAPVSPFVAELATPRAADEPWPESTEGLITSRSGSDRQASGTTPKKKRERSEPSGPQALARRDALSEWRTQRCKSDGVPAYVVLDNATLDAIAEEGPSSLVTLGRIKGIGPAKLERYGADILGVVADVEME